MKKKFLVTRVYLFFAAQNVAVSCVQFQNKHIWRGTIVHIKSIKDDGKPGKEEGHFQ